MAFTNLEKTDMVLVYGEARGHTELVRQIYGERFPQRIFSNSGSFVNVVQHRRGFGRLETSLEMNKRDLGRPQEDRIFVAKDEILHEIENQPRTSTRRLANHLRVSQFLIWLRVQNAAQEIR
jgi:hypothetical protein